MAPGAECPVVNQLRLDIGAFGCNILGNDFCKTFTYLTHTEFFYRQKSDVSVRANQPGANM
jgi:hypothetical protein